MTRIIQEDVGSPCTDQMLWTPFQRKACVCLLDLGEVRRLEVITFPPGEHHKPGDNQSPEESKQTSVGNSEGMIPERWVYTAFQIIMQIRF